MSQTITITITSAGPDLGPYSILLVDNLNNVTVAVTGVPKSALFAGYTITIPDNIVKVRLQSVNADCPYTEFFIPEPPPPDPTCYYVFAGNGYNVTWTDNNGVSHTSPYISSSPVYCARLGSLTVDDSNAVIIGGTVACTSTCDIPPCTCTTITNLTNRPTTYNYISCSGVAIMNQPLNGNETVEVCGSLFNSPGLVDILNGNQCVIYSVEYQCPTTTSTSTTTTTTVPPCDCVTVQTVKGDGVVNYVDCNGTGASQSLIDGTAVSICVRSIPTSTDYTITNNGPCNSGSICLTIPCNCYEIISDLGGSITYTDCNGNIVPELFVGGGTSIYVCGSNVTQVSGFVNIYSTGSPCVLVGSNYECYLP